LLKNHHDKINNLIAKEIFGLKKYDEEFININEGTKNITGGILKKENLKHFSTKFYQAYVDMEENLFIGGPNSNTESRIGFIYSNLVKTGIEIFQEILIINGFLPYEENKNNYQIKNNTKCYFCGKTYKDHDNTNTNENNKNKEDIQHKFSPATFIVVKGQSTEEGAENIPEESKKIVSTVFSNISNKTGKNIKIVLGSKVMNEGISLHNVATVQILDVYFNFGRVDQVIGRAIRYCSHYNLMSESNPYPKVKVYKYAVSIDSTKSKKHELSTEEELYYKAEQKYILVKKIERGLKEIAIDCALNQQGNMFKEEIEYYNKCVKPNDKLYDSIITENYNEKKKSNPADLIVCPAKCDFTDCAYKCAEPKLNSKYYDPNRNIYKKLSKSQLDLSTFTSNLARTEIEYAKRKIKELYMVGYVYNLKAISDYVEDSYDKAKKDLFDDFFVQKALDELIPITENDFNNFIDIIFDKTRRSGYLIYLDGYYIFQPFDENENAPMNYRTTYQYDFSSKLSLHNYLINEQYDIMTDIGSELEIGEDNINESDFIDVMDYYDNRKEYDIVGIIDKQTNKKKTTDYEDIKDIFKIREKREKVLEKKRGTGIPSLKGAVCATSKEKEYLETLAKNIGVKINKKNRTRDNICELIKDKLIELEKYSKGKNKMTYIMIPSNHPTLKFPLNLEDRIEYIKTNVNKILSKNISFKEKTNSEKKYIELTFKLTSKPNNDDITKLEKLGLETKDKLKWNVLID
jgi:transcriptional regulator NrdR family protein